MFVGLSTIVTVQANADAKVHYSLNDFGPIFRAMRSPMRERVINVDNPSAYVPDEAAINERLRLAIEDREKKDLVHDPM